METGALVWVMAVAALAGAARAVVPATVVPGPVLELAAGLVLGPSLLGLLVVDDPVRTVAVLGLSVLLLLAGSELDLGRLRLREGRAALLGGAVAVVLAALAGVALTESGLLPVGAAVLVAAALTGSALGLLVPVLSQAGRSGTAAGQALVAGASVGELTALLGLSLLVGMGVGAPTGPTLLPALVAVPVAVLLLGRTSPAARWVRLLLATPGARSAQTAVRFVVVLVLLLTTAATGLGVEAVLGAFVAGLVLRGLAPRSPDGMVHAVPSGVVGLAHGFLVPVFFVASGAALDLRGLIGAGRELLLVPALVLALLLVRGVPALLQHALPLRERVGVGALQAVSLPLLVTAATIGRESGLLPATTAAAVVLAGLLATLGLLPVGLRLLPEAPRAASARLPVAAAAR